MPQSKTLIIDACLPIAKFRGEDPPVIQQDVDTFFSLIENNPLKIRMIQRVIDEAHKKYPHLSQSINDYLGELKTVNKFELIPTKLFVNDISNIAKIKEHANNQDYDYNLSFEDSLQIFYSNKVTMPLISLDNGLLDYCDDHGFKAYRPRDFCEEYNKIND